MYNMGVRNLKDKQVFDIIEKHLYMLRGRFSPRLAFGGLYGSLKCGGSQYCVEFYMQEVTEMAEYISNKNKQSKNSIYAVLNPSV
jgi:hypothetical protein